MRGWFADFLIDHPRLVTVYLIVATPVVILMVVVLQIIPEARGDHQNFQTLRSDLAKVHLRPGYRLTAEHKAGTDCANDGCSLTQTWTWVRAHQPTGSSACSAVFNAMNSAFSDDVESNSPIPANAACDYYTTVESFFHTEQGKRDIEAIVQIGNNRTGEDLKVTISASYL